MSNGLIIKKTKITVFLLMLWSEGRALLPVFLMLSLNAPW
jgi:hypothetical protein